jgi:hypothetical protein
MTKQIKEDGEGGVAFSSSTPVNAMGASSSVAGRGGIDTYDPMLAKKKKPLRSIVKRKAPM